MDVDNDKWITWIEVTALYARYYGLTISMKLLTKIKQKLI